MLKAADMSNHGGELSPGMVEALKEAGITTVIVGAGPIPYGRWTVQQASMASVGGMTVEAYVYLEMTSSVPPIEWARYAYDSLGDKAQLVSRWWLNVEDPDFKGTQAEAEELIDEFLSMLDRLTGKKTGICTFGYWWRSVMGGTSKYADRLLWNMYHDDDPDLDYPQSPYGWPAGMLALEQYTGTINVGGASVDLNSVYIPAEPYRPPATSNPPEPLEQLVLMIANILAGPVGTDAEWTTVDAAIKGLQPLFDSENRVLVGIGEVRGQIADIRNRSLKSGVSYRLVEA